MKRRDFLRLGAAAGILTFGPVRLGMANSTFSGPYWLFVEALGGWDQTSFCDPKGRGLGPNGDINNYDQDDIGTVGNFAYAPPPDSFPGGGGLFTNQEFFTNHFERLLVINGINHRTNSHAVGTTAAWTGTRALNYPSIAALIAAENGSDLPLPFLGTGRGSGAIKKTLSVVPSVSVLNGNSGTLRAIAFSNRTNPTNPDPSRQYHADSVLNLIHAAGEERRQRQIAGQRLLRLNNALLRHDGARDIDTVALGAFVDNLDNTSAPNAVVNSSNGARNLFGQAQTAFAAFEAGAAATAQISIGGFDTHDDHDANHYPALMGFLAAIDNVIDDATTRGLADNLIIVMSSDFGRTPKYNGDAGKDHSPHSSTMVWGSPSFFTGNRVVGATDGNQRSLPINPNTLELDSSGIIMTSEHMHQAYRSLAGIDQNPNVAGRFPFAEAVLPIFS